MKINIIDCKQECFLCCPIMLVFNALELDLDCNKLLLFKNDIFIGSIDLNFYKLKYVRSSICNVIMYDICEVKL
ncbi:hypothetical protein [Clostridium butyricum]|uniref:hypothetical protein n=1 Tax=Clostridium butyricum TaxID=1492 RepID=UPI002ABE09F8|nr:hypothetical protein [Clostridium butyricum]